jgi:hypothetical protein
VCALVRPSRHLREWSAKIRLLVLREHGLLLQFYFFGLLGVILVIVFHEIGFPDYISRPPATLKRIKLTARVLPLLDVALSLPRLQPGCSRAPATRANRSLEPTSLRSCTKRRRIRFFWKCYSRDAPDLCHGSTSDKIQGRCVSGFSTTEQ